MADKNKAAAAVQMQTHHTNILESMRNMTKVPKKNPKILASAAEVLKTPTFPTLTKHAKCIYVGYSPSMKVSQFTVFRHS